MKRRQRNTDRANPERRSVRRSFAPGRAHSLRHLGISVAAVVAYGLRRELAVSSAVLWVLALAVLANLVLALLSDLRAWAGVARQLSPFFGLVGWSALVFSTGGIRSPFEAGFGLEIVLSVLLVSPLGTLLTTGGALGAIWLTQAPLGPGPVMGRLLLETAFIAAIGLLAFAASRRWVHAQRDVARESSLLNRRLCDLEREVETALRLGRVGERAARLAHGIKGTVHNLRGFTKLIEMPSSAVTRREAMAGLQHAIDRLEEMARDTLGSRAEVSMHARPSHADVARTVDDVIDEMSRRHAGLRWRKPTLEGIPSVGVPAPILREILLILAQNAAEATGSAGEIELYAGIEGCSLCLGVRDHGPGFPTGINLAALRPGVTTKPLGSGYGLVLARRLVEARGGSLSIARAPEGGARVAVHLPVQFG